MQMTSDRCDRAGRSGPFLRAARAALLAGAVAGLGAAAVAADPADDVAAIERLLDEGRDGEAEAAARAALARAEASPDGSGRETARLVKLVGDALYAGQRFADAEPFYRRAVEEALAAFPGERATLSQWRLRLGHTLRQMNLFAEAETAYREAIADGEAAWGRDDPALVPGLEGAARMAENLGRPAEALPSYRRAMHLREAAEGPESGPVGALALRVGVNLLAIDEPLEAAPHLRRALAIREVVQGPGSEGVADAARWLATALERVGRDAEAELFRRQALAVSDAVHGAQHVYTAFDMTLLGLLYSGQRRFSEAEPLLTRAVAILEGDPRTVRNAGAARLALVSLLEAQGRTDEAATRLERVLSDAAGAGNGLTRETAAAMDSLARIRLQQGDLAEADRLARDALAFHEGEGMSATLLSSRQLVADVLLASGRGDEALAINRDVLARLQARFGDGSPQARRAHAAIGNTYFALGDFAAAAGHLERAFELAQREAVQDLRVAASGGTGAVEDRVVATAGNVALLVRSWFRLAAEESDLIERAFVAAQRIIDSRAAAALSQMGARQAAGSGELAALVRERQDLADAWRLEDRRRTDMLALPLDRRDRQRMDDNARRLEQAALRLDAVDRVLAEEFPGFAGLQSPSVLDVAGVQAALADDEVLLFYADMTRRGAGDPETFLWAVPKQGAARWVRLDRDSGALYDAVRTLRGLMGVGPATRGAAALAAPARADRAGEILSAAHDLHRTVLGPVADMIEGRSLVVVPSERLAGLPFQLLVSQLPAAGSQDRYRDARWVARDHAVTVLPSVAALAAPAGPAAAPRRERTAYLGFANPLLTGASGSDRRAFGRHGCEAGEPVEAALADAVDLPAIGALFRGAAADVDAVRSLAPLPETVDEACAVAAALGAEADAVRQGADATEAEVKRLSEEGTLARASILHFATHALVSGELSGLAEPAIVLTPPGEAGPLDDGLLTASEVTMLKLDADWVILSACNTASGEEGGEALSGLARAFFYAGARALMVSHWPVNSDAAVRLATGAIDELAADPRLGRAEALRRSMAAEIARGGRHADPANWAPFILVGAERRS